MSRGQWRLKLFHAWILRRGRGLLKASGAVTVPWNLKGADTACSSGEKTHPARRRVVEHTLGWLSKDRAILVRYDEKPANYLGLLQLAFVLIWYRRQWSLANLR